MRRYMYTKRYKSLFVNFHTRYDFRDSIGNNDHALSFGETFNLVRRECLQSAAATGGRNGSSKIFMK